MGLYNVNKLNSDLASRKKRGKNLQDANSVRPDPHTNANDEAQSEGTAEQKSRRKKISDMSNSEQIEAAKETILNILTYMPRTTHELEEKLNAKGYSNIAITQAIERMTEVGIINDQSFAEGWAQSRFNSAGKSPYAIRFELKRKGLSDEIIDKAVEPFEDEAVQKAKAMEMAEAKVASLTRGDKEITSGDVKKIASMLARKGFAPGICFEVAKTAVADFSSNLNLNEETT